MSKAMTLRLDDAEHEHLRFEAFQRRTSISDLVRGVLRFVGSTAPAMTHPCPATVEGPFLGVSTDSDPTGATTYVRCSDVEGHDGDHYHLLRWTTPTPNGETR